MPLSDRKVIITGGPTREWIDPVRYISNPSSGRMGIALAGKALGRAGSVVFVHGPIDASFLAGMHFRTRPVITTEDMLNAVLDELESSAVLIMAAAPADYTPVAPFSTKLKKQGDTLSVEFKQTPDILKSIALLKSKDSTLSDLFLTGFAAETNNTEENALSKLKRKQLDMICLNDVTREGAGFGTKTNAVTIFTKGGERFDLPLMSKDDIAIKILDQVELELQKL